MKSLSKVFIACLFSLSIYPHNVSSWPVPDTDQVFCFNNINAGYGTNCPQEGEPFFGQDANYTINKKSYTKLDKNGVELGINDNGAVMIRDNVSGLIWLLKNIDGIIGPFTEGPMPGPISNINSVENVFSYDDAQNEFIKYLNDNKVGGFSDWRLPTAHELATIFYRGQNYNDFRHWFPNNNSWAGVATYWTDTVDSNDPSLHYVMNYDAMIGMFSKVNGSDPYKARAVRGDTVTFESRLNTFENEHVVDSGAGLMWQKAPSFYGTWESALQYAETSSLGGFSDWRLPTVNEIFLLRDYLKADVNRVDPLLDLGADTIFWSSTCSERNQNQAYVFQTSDVMVSSVLKGGSQSALLVRGGHDGYGISTLKIDQPKQADRLHIGSTVTIQWSGWPNPAADIWRISISREGGKAGTFQSVGEVAGTESSFTWEVIGPESTACAIKVEPLNGPENVIYQSLVTIAQLRSAWITVGKLQGLERLKLTLNGLYNDGIFPLDAQWSISDPSIATVNKGFVDILQNGRIEISATFEGKTYTRSLFVSTETGLLEAEPNNLEENSTPIADGSFYKGHFYVDDVDYYRIDLSTDSLIDIGYISESATADMLVEVYSAAGALVASGVSNDGESLVFPLGLVVGAYYVKLTSAGDVDQYSDYIISYLNLGEMPPKATEPLELGIALQSEIYNLGDETTYTFSLVEPEALELTFTPTSGSAKYFIEILNSYSQVVDKVEALEGLPVTIEMIFTAGDYTVRITPIDDVDAGGPFSTEINTSNNQLEVESNDTTRKATSYDINLPIIGRLSNLDDIDFFEFHLDVPRYLQIDFAVPDSSKNYQIFLYKDSDENLIDGTQVEYGNPVSLDIGLGVGRYFIKVISDGVDADTVNYYTLSISDSSQTNLEIESNNTLKFANAIDKNSGKLGRIYRAEDSDYYGFHTSEEGIFQITFKPESTVADYVISVLDENDQMFDMWTSENGFAYTRDIYKLPGNYYIRVDCNGDIDEHKAYEVAISSGIAIEGVKKIVSVTVAGSEGEMTISDTQTMAATATYSDATAEYISSPVWSSLNSNVAAVDSAGFVVAVGQGTTTIVATHGGLTGSFDITVGAPPQTVDQHYDSLVIVAGSGTGPEDPLNESAQYLANLVYKRFKTRLFKDEDIYYFNPVAEHDLDGDGYDDNIVDDATPTVAEFGNSVTNWAANQNTDGPLFIYLVGHGLIDTFSFPSETLAATDFNDFIDTFQAATGRRVVIIIEACKSGSFLDDLVRQGENRIVITSTDDQDAYMQWGGKISFTQFFINKLLAGGSMHAGWLKGIEKLGELELPFKLMNPQLVDGMFAASEYTWLGGDFVIAHIFPGWVIGQVLDASTGATLEGAEIEVSGAINVTTLENGCFLAQVPTGIYDVTATAFGYKPVSISSLEVTLGESLIRNFSLTKNIADMTGDLNADGLDLTDAIIALQILAGIDLPAHLRHDYISSGIDVSGDNQVGLEEVIFILQGVSRVRN